MTRAVLAPQPCPEADPQTLRTLSKERLNSDSGAGASDEGAQRSRPWVCRLMGRESATDSGFQAGGAVDPKWKNNGRKANPASGRKCSFPIVRHVIRAFTQTWQRKTGSGQERSVSFPLGPGSAQG